MKREQSQRAVRISLDVEKGNSITKGDTCFLIQVRSVQDCKEKKGIPEEVSKILDDYKDVFEEPKGLPPRKSHDHRIPLKPDGVHILINARTYTRQRLKRWLKKC